MIRECPFQVGCLRSLLEPATACLMWSMGRTALPVMLPTNCMPEKRISHFFPRSCCLSCDISRPPLRKRDPSIRHPGNRWLGVSKPGLKAHHSNWSLWVSFDTSPSLHRTEPSRSCFLPRQPGGADQSGAGPGRPHQRGAAQRQGHEPGPSESIGQWDGGPDAWAVEAICEMPTAPPTWSPEKEGVVLNGYLFST